MPKEPISVEIIQEGEERFMLKTFGDGTEERVPIVKLPRKQPRLFVPEVDFRQEQKKGILECVGDGHTASRKFPTIKRRTSGQQICAVQQISHR
jgi:hypothetical protein